MKIIRLSFYSIRGTLLACYLFCISCMVVQVPAASETSGWIPLFNGENLEGWTPKFAGYPLGENFKNIFRVEEGLLKVSYDDVETFNGEFGHLYYEVPFSHYKIRAEYRFKGDQVKGGPGWAFRNNGLMLHCQNPVSIPLDQPFPTCIEVQLLGSLGDIVRPNANLYTPQTHIVFNGKLREEHGTSSLSEPFHGDEWVTVEVEVHGSEVIIHRVNGQEVIRSQYPQFHDGTLIDGGYIAIQAETAPTEFRRIEVLPLVGNRAISHDGRSASMAMNVAPEGYRALFDGQTLSGWRLHPASEGHWVATQGVIDYDAGSKAEGADKHLWTEDEFGDFELRIDWRIKRTAGLYRMYRIKPNGEPMRNSAGEIELFERQNADSGIFLRGSQKSQVNIWCWPVGSGEVWGYRTDENMSPEVRANVVPLVNADHPVGEWNQYVITVKGDRLTVKLNGQLVIDDAQLPDIPKLGSIGLQHHGGITEDGFYDGAASMVQFRNIFIKEL